MPLRSWVYTALCSLSMATDEIPPGSGVRPWVPAWLPRPVALRLLLVTAPAPSCLRQPCLPALSLPFPTHLHSPHNGPSLLLPPATCTPTSALHSAHVQLGWAQPQRGRLRDLTSKPCQSEPGLQWRSKINQETIWPENVRGGEDTRSTRGGRERGWACFCSCFWRNPSSSQAPR